MSVGFYNLDFLKTRFSFALMTTCFFSLSFRLSLQSTAFSQFAASVFVVNIYNLQTVYRYNTPTAHAAFSTDLEIARDMSSIAINRA